MRLVRSEPDFQLECVSGIDGELKTELERRHSGNERLVQATGEHARDPGSTSRQPAQAALQRIVRQSSGKGRANFTRGLLT